MAVIKGNRKLYADIFEVGYNKDHSQVNNRELRDNALAARYYYHAQLLRQSYTTCLEELHKEFFISPDNIVDRLSGRTELLKEMVSNQTTPKDLKKAYPHFDWSVLRIN